MKSLPNVEKSAFRKGEYVGYAHGVWRIIRSNGCWIARPVNDTRSAIVESTLADISVRLEMVTPA